MLGPRISVLPSRPGPRGPVLADAMARLGNRFGRFLAPRLDREARFRHPGLDRERAGSARRGQFDLGTVSAGSWVLAWTVTLGSAVQPWTEISGSRGFRRSGPVRSGPVRFWIRFRSGPVRFFMRIDSGPVHRRSQSDLEPRARFLAGLLGRFSGPIGRIAIRRTVPSGPNRGEEPKTPVPAYPPVPVPVRFWRISAIGPRSLRRFGLTGHTLHQPQHEGFSTDTVFCSAMLTSI